MIHYMYNYSYLYITYYNIVLTHKTSISNISLVYLKRLSNESYLIDKNENVCEFAYVKTSFIFFTSPM